MLPDVRVVRNFGKIFVNGNLSKAARDALKDSNKQESFTWRHERGDCAPKVSCESTPSH